MQFLAVQEGRIKDPIWLKIDVSVMLASDVKFTTKVSNDSEAIILNHSKAAKEIDFKILFTYTEWRGSIEVHNKRKAAEKSEILVPGIVPIDKILDFRNG